MRPTLLTDGLGLAVALLASLATAADWPTYRHDAQRRGITSEEINPSQLKLRWVYRSSAAPATAWPGPAKWDAYARIRGLRAMRNYDMAAGVTAVGDSVFASSSADDSVYCLDGATGKIRWSFCTDGPVRIAATIWEGHVFFGSDDGAVYCLRASDGALVWKFKPPGDRHRIINNGRLIAPAPCRTGVLISEGTAYCAFSLLPWNESFFCALDARTGKPVGEGRFVKQLRGLTFEGPMVATETRLIAPQGRQPPRVFKRVDGAAAGTLPGGGGSFALVTADNTILHGPGNKTGWITCSDPTTCKEITTHKACNAMLLDGDRTFVMSDDHVAAIDASGKKTHWRTATPSATTFVGNSQHLLVGGADYLAVLDRDDGKQLWHASVDGAVYELAIANGMVLASTDEGRVYCFAVDGKLSVRTERVLLVDSPHSPTQAKPQTNVTSKRHPHQIHGWRMESGMSARARRRGLSDPQRVVLDAVGNIHGRIDGEIIYRTSGGLETLELDGKTSILLTDDHKQAKLPAKSLSVEAWVRVDKPLTWGSVVGAIQDNGSFERGWLLGFKDSKFCFGLASQKTNKLTYLTAAEDFQLGEWHHVVGVYDGQRQQLFVNGKLAAESNEQQGEIAYPPKAFFEIGAYHDDDEDFHMTGLIHEVNVFRQPLPGGQIEDRFRAKQELLPRVIRLAAGPYVRFTSPESADVAWHTAEPMVSRLTLASGRGARVFSSEEPTTRHRLAIDGLIRGRVYSYVIQGRTGATPRFELDTSFNYTLHQVPKQEGLYPDKPSKEMANAAESLLEVGKVRHGICVLIGVGDGQLAYELARRSQLRVVGVDTDAGAINQARQALMRVGVYGSRVALHHVESYDELPFVGDFANLVASESFLHRGTPDGKIEEYLRLVRPNGGRVILGKPAKGFGDVDLPALRNWFGSHIQAARHHKKNGHWIVSERPALVGAGEWSHQYGRADNSAFGGEELSGASSPQDFRVQWVGRPGPRAQPDRNGRKPSPLAVNGRLFVQGLNRLIGIDAFNGTILWSLEIPPLARFNIPRDSSNWCADDNSLYVAIKDACWRIDAQTGDVLKLHPVLPGQRDDFAYDWSYVARVDGVLIGSAVKQGTAYLDFWGNADAGWYDARKGPVTFKVCSENLFAMDPATGKKRWSHDSGVILNSTITAGEGRVVFVECRNSKVKSSDTRRVGMSELWEDQFLVAVDLSTGKKLFEKPIDTVDGTVVFYMAQGEGKLAVVASTNGNYHVYGFDAETGKPAWSQSFKWPGGKGDHGKAMNRPAIVGNRLYVRPKVLDLATGEIVRDMPPGGCGTYALTRNAAIYRSGSGGLMTLWDTGSARKPESWERLRPGCWLSTIPANGMLLSPEAGGGCSCGKWMETSIGFAPLFPAKP